MARKEGIIRSALHIPGDYLRGMDGSLVDDNWVVNSVLAHVFIGFIGGGIVGLIGALGFDTFEKMRSQVIDPNSLGVGWWIGVGLVNVAITGLAIAEGRQIRKGRR